VRRASAISLLAAICFSLIAPLAFADPESNLPECCRRSGAHHCSMTDDAASADGTHFQSIATKCPAFPVATAAPFSPDVALLKGSGAIFAAVVSHPSIHFQTEARYRVSFSRSRQKRGPPTILS
jgi:hypothetical protein